MQESEFIQLSHTKVDNTKYGRYTGIQGERKKKTHCFVPRQPGVRNY